VTFAGYTICIETSWIESTKDMELSEDGRFVSFEWFGYEAYGFKLVDRSGAGAVMETDLKPVSAPSGMLIAAYEHTESGFGSLNALGIWQVSANPVREVAIVQLPEGLTDWRFDRWNGENCIEISATSFEQLDEDGSRPGYTARNRFVSRSIKGWEPEPTGESGCPPR
jgi:hypothetical protein